MISQHPPVKIAGSDASTLYYSEDVIKQARKPKELFVVPSKSHVDLYGLTECPDPKLTQFFQLLSPSLKCRFTEYSVHTIQLQY